jgi:hypothetical protein
VFAVVSVRGNRKVTIPLEYVNFENLFREKKGREALPKYQPWDYEIRLKLGTTPTAIPIYSLSEK